MHNRAFEQSPHAQAENRVTLTIDGAEASVSSGQPLIEVLRARGTAMPTLCYHPSLAAYGACRLCLVEATAEGRTALVPSCSTPVSAGMAVRTDSPDAVRARKLSMQLILARCPDIQSLWDFAAKMGVTDTPFEHDKQASREADCILCGLCERVCRELIGQAAISASGRGAAREVVSPFDAENGDGRVRETDCIGCGACVAVCPTGKVRTRIMDGAVVLEAWRTRLEMASCAHCGQTFAPARYIEYVKARAERLGIPADAGGVIDLCPRCRARALAANLQRTAGSYSPRHSRESGCPDLKSTLCLADVGSRLRGNDSESTTGKREE